MNDFINNIKKMKKDPKGKAILFFGFYFLFFLFIAVIARMGDRSSIYRPTNNSSSFDFTFSNLESNNYKYNYTITVDDVKYEVIGQKYDNEELFTYLNKNYYVKDGQFFIEDEIWLKTDNPIPFNNFIDVLNIEKLLKLASYESKTTYESGKVNYNYLISSNTINSLLFGIDSDFFEEPNKIIVSTMRYKIDQISYNLDSFCTLNKMCEKSLRIELSYENFGEIEKIDNPLD